MLLEANGLTRSFGSLTAVDRVDFALPQGEVRAVIGHHAWLAITQLHGHALDHATTQRRMADLEAGIEDGHRHALPGRALERPGTVDDIQSGGPLETRQVAREGLRPGGQLLDHDDPVSPCRDDRWTPAAGPRPAGYR